MSTLEYRDMAFDFDDAPTPFLWNPENPGFSVHMNAVSFLAVAWERYITMSVKKVLKEIRDPAVRHEANLFIRQEGQHSSAHRKHVNALCAQYPALESVLQNAISKFDQLRSDHPTQFHVAYMANIEATFPALFGVLIDHQHALFANGDQRVASLMLWHFIEEIEHRSAALSIYEATNRSRWYRTRVMRESLNHMAAVFQSILNGFRDALPEELAAVAAQDQFTRLGQVGRSELRTHLLGRRNSNPPRSGTAASAYSRVSGRRIVGLLCRIALSQTPLYDPQRESVPAGYRTWMDHHRAGCDMTRFYGVPAGTVTDPAS